MMVLVLKGLAAVAASILWWSSFIIGSFIPVVVSQRFDCNPCIKRDGYKIQAFFIMDNTGSSSFASDQVKLGAMKTAEGLGVEMEIMEYGSDDDVSEISAELLKVSDTAMDDSQNRRPDAIIVSIPDGNEVIYDAVEAVIDSGIPVFGYGMGYKDAPFLDASTWVAQDEYLAGWGAVTPFINALESVAADQFGDSVGDDGDNGMDEGGVSSFICPICGEGMIPTIMDGTVTIPTQGDFSCQDLVNSALAGDIEEANCGLLTNFVLESCGCAAQDEAEDEGLVSSELSVMQLNVERVEDFPLSSISPVECESIVSTHVFSGSCCSLSTTEGGGCILNVINGDCQVRGQEWTFDYTSTFDEGSCPPGEFMPGTQTMLNALFINSNVDSSVLQDRFQGFNDHLEELGMTVETLVVNGTLESDALKEAITSTLEGCPYNAILVGDGAIFDSVPMDACKGVTVIGSFDTNPSMYPAISSLDLAFGISEQHYLQGAISALFATSFITTGKIPATPLVGDYGVYLAGPSIVHVDNLPDDASMVELNNIRIGGVLHGVTTDSFWDVIFVAAETASEDMGVQLDLDRFEPEETDEIVHLKMSNKIKFLCSGDSPVDGIFVTIPSDVVLEAVLECKAAGIPVIAINAGVEAAEEHGLVHYIGQLEYNSGFGAAQELISHGIKNGWCVNHEVGTATTVQRCQGMEDAFALNPDVEYMGQIVVPRDNVEQYKSDVQLVIDDDGLWDGYGLLLTGQIQVPAAIELLEDHPNVVIGTFDLSDLVFGALDEGQIVFGIDQQPYLQGYMPVPLLTHAIVNKQQLSNSVIESGPSFVLSAPSEKQLMCEAQFYDVCRPEESGDPASEGGAPGDRTSQDVDMSSTDLPSEGSSLLLSGISFALMAAIGAML